jgi:GT2 family glycosyltransferase
MEPVRARPPVSVVVPFAGSRADAAAVVAELDGLATRDGDELFMVDNSPSPVAEQSRDVTMLRAGRVASSYHARNVGAASARSEWLLFVDSDCRLPPTLIDDYFTEHPAERTGLVAGEIDGDPAQDGLVPRYHRSREHLRAAAPLELGPSPAAGTANLLVRRAAWVELDGFEEVFSGADFDFSWRAGAAGWGVEYRPSARVQHRHPAELGAMRAKARRYGAGQRWLESRYPGVPRRPGLLREAARGAGGIVAWTITARFERAAFKALDVVWIAAYANGWYRGDNRARPLGGAT